MFIVLCNYVSKLKQKHSGFCIYKATRFQIFHKTTSNQSNNIFTVSKIWRRTYHISSRHHPLGTSLQYNYQCASSFYKL